MVNNEGSSNCFKIERNFFGYYTVLCAIFFTVGCTVAVYINFGLMATLLCGILMARLLIYGSIDYVVPKKIFVCNENIFIKWGWINFKLDLNNTIVRIEDLFSYSRATKYKGLVLYRDRRKVLKLSFKNRIRLIGGISEKEINTYSKTLNNCYGLKVIEY